MVWCFSTRASVATVLTTHPCVSRCLKVNTLRLRQYGRCFADNVSKCIFLNENVWISLKISLKFVPKVPINSIPALVQILAWRRLGDKPLSEAMMVSLLTHICVTRPQWVKHVSKGAHLLLCSHFFNKNMEVNTELTTKVYSVLLLFYSKVSITYMKIYTSSNMANSWFLI